MATEKINQENIRLRAAQISDEAFLETVYADARRDELAAFGWSAEQENAFFKMQFALQKRAYAMQFPDADYSIVEFNNRAIGRAIVLRGELEIRLIDITLFAAFRNRGVGSFLIERLKDEARRDGKILRLRVLKTNDGARRLYERLNLTIESEEELHFSMRWRG